jgi:hypothetical protein
MMQEDSNGESSFEFVNKRDETSASESSQSKYNNIMHKIQYIIL